MSSLGDEYYDIDSILAEHEVRHSGISGWQYKMILMVRLVLMWFALDIPWSQKVPGRFNDSVGAELNLTGEGVAVSFLLLFKALALHDLVNAHWLSWIRTGTKWD
jgi:hypothetical protein